ncbi:hypothetical protein E2562_035143 [Oryza meyeriana var. granulata]|uniref:Uncharacterized protein n=1 Tax=Oryza meyeriana var. granulata TaxID=110450 RepID=A0A6G1F1R0_9ORYZ|nr:hypothetical protein E2562_035143 [Oryza meyeriana var. granulata]
MGWRRLVVAPQICRGEGGWDTGKRGHELCTPISVVEATPEAVAGSGGRIVRHCSAPEEADGHRYK